MTVGQGIAVAGIWISVAVTAFAYPYVLCFMASAATLATWIVASRKTECGRRLEAGWNS